MNRIFLREWRKGFIADGSTLLVLTSILIVSGEQRQQELAVVLESSLFSMIVLSGFVTGARSFPSAFKDRDALLLRCLPIRRQRLWLAITSAHILAALTAIGFATAALAVTGVRWPSFLSGFTELTGGLLGALVLFLVSYYAGSVLSLLIRKSFVVYALGLPVTELALYQLQFLVRSACAIPTLEETLSSLRESSTPWVVVLLSVLPLAAGISAELFSNGELASVRHTIVNLLFATASSLAWLALALTFWLTPFLQKTLCGWPPLPPDAIQPPREILTGRGSASHAFGWASPDGLSLEVPEYSRIRPWLARTNIAGVDPRLAFERSVFDWIDVPPGRARLRESDPRGRLGGIPGHRLSLPIFSRAEIR